MPYYEDDLNFGNFAAGTIPTYNPAFVTPINVPGSGYGNVGGVSEVQDDASDLALDPYDRPQITVSSIFDNRPPPIPAMVTPDPVEDPAPTWTLPKVGGWQLPTIGLPFTPPDLSMEMPEVGVTDAIGTVFPIAGIGVEAVKNTAPVIAGIAGILPIMLLMMAFKD